MTSVNRGRLVGQIVVPLLGLAIHVAFSSQEHGVFHADEIYQTLEQAHRAAFGFGITPWEFQYGARSWILPGLLAGLMRGAAAIGVQDGLALVWVARAGMLAFALVGFVCASRLGERIAGPRGAIFATAMCACLPLDVVLAYRTTSESCVASCALLVAWLTDPIRGSRTAEPARPPPAVWKLVLAGILAGLAVCVRVQSAAFFVPFVIPVALAHGWRRGGAFVLGVGLGACMGGAVDWATWGAPFHSIRAYVDFNVASGGQDLNPQSLGYYGEHFARTVGVLGTVLVVLGLVALGRRGYGALATLGAIVVFVAAHHALSGKQLRFLYPVVPLAAALAGAGLATLPFPFTSRLPSLAPSIAAAFVAGVMLFHAGFVTYGDLGWTHDAPYSEKLRIWRTYLGAMNFALAEVGRRPDVCGVYVEPSLVLLGGYAYLHRNVPFTGKRVATGNYAIGLANRSFAQLVTSLPAAQRYERVWRLGKIAVFRRPGGCVPDPEFSPLRVFTREGVLGH